MIHEFNPVHPVHTMKLHFYYKMLINNINFRLILSERLLIAKVI